MGPWTRKAQLELVAHDRRAADAINTQLHRNSGLESRIVEAVADRYRLGQLRAARTMKRSLETLPAECPYNGDAIVNRPFEFEADR